MKMRSLRFWPADTNRLVVLTWVLTMLSWAVIASFDGRSYRLASWAVFASWSPPMILSWVKSFKEFVSLRRSQFKTLWW